MLTVVLPGALRLLERPDPPALESSGLAPLRIDVHAAPWYEWALLDGIGEARGRRIADFVASRRPLRSLDELAQIPGMPRGWLDAARPHLRLDGAGSVPERTR